MDVDKRLRLLRANVAYADFRSCDATDNIKGVPVAYVEVIIHDDNAIENFNKENNFMSSAKF